jgi:aldehyde dehydrogenase (NAD+)
MDHRDEVYIGGRWVEPVDVKRWMVIDPATEQPIAEVALGGPADVALAVAAARAAFPAFPRTSVEARIALIERIAAAFDERRDDFAASLTREIGAPTALARQQGEMAAAHLKTMLETLKGFAFERISGSLKVVKEPIGVVGCITPWNAPVSQMLSKVVPSLAVGCTTVVKPSEYAPLSALLLAEVMEAAEVPAGAFNMVNGDGAAGAALASHPDVDMMSFTGSVRTGAAIAKASADTVKRLCQELGGKSPNIILPDADLEAAVRGGVMMMFFHTGQTCGAPSRMFVPRELHDEAIKIARGLAEGLKVGDPTAQGTDLGPLVNKAQFERVNRLIQSGIDEGARLVCGGPGRPDGLTRGYYVRPTIFTDVRPEMAIVREEIFGPVLCVIAYDDVEEAVEQANATPYGLVGYIQSRDPAKAADVAGRIRAGYVSINYPPMDLTAPFGGYKQSGNGRQWGAYALDEAVELKALVRHEAW